MRKITYLNHDTNVSMEIQIEENNDGTFNVRFFTNNKDHFFNKEGTDCIPRLDDDIFINGLGRLIEFLFIGENIKVKEGFKKIDE